MMLHHVQALIEVIVTREESPLPPPAPPEQSQGEHRGVNMAETRDTDEDEEIARHKKTIATKVTHPFYNKINSNLSKSKYLMMSP